MVREAIQKREGANMNGLTITREDAVLLCRQIGGEDDWGSATDPYSQFAASIELLFSGLQVSDREFDYIADALIFFQKQYRQGVIFGVYQTPNN